MVPAYAKLDFETIFQAQVADDAFVIGFHLPKRQTSICLFGSGRALRVSLAATLASLPHYLARNCRDDEAGSTWSYRKIHRQRRFS